MKLSYKDTRLELAIRQGQARLELRMRSRLDLRIAMMSSFLTQRFAFKSSPTRLELRGTK